MVTCSAEKTYVTLWELVVWFKGSFDYDWRAYGGISYFWDEVAKAVKSAIEEQFPKLKGYVKEVLAGVNEERGQVGYVIATTYFEVLIRIGGFEEGYVTKEELETLKDIVKNTVIDNYVKPVPPYYLRDYGINIPDWYSKVTKYFKVDVGKAEIREYPAYPGLAYIELTPETEPYVLDTYLTTVGMTVDIPEIGRKVTRVLGSEEERVVYSNITEGFNGTLSVREVKELDGKEFYVYFEGLDKVCAYTIRMKLVSEEPFLMVSEAVELGLPPPPPPERAPEDYPKIVSAVVTLDKTKGKVGEKVTGSVEVVFTNMDNYARWYAEGYRIIMHVSFFMNGNTIAPSQTIELLPEQTRYVIPFEFTVPNVPVGTYAVRVGLAFTDSEGKELDFMSMWCEPVEFEVTEEVPPPPPPPPEEIPKILENVITVSRTSVVVGETITLTNRLVIEEKPIPEERTYLVIEVYLNGFIKEFKLPPQTGEVVYSFPITINEEGTFILWTEAYFYGQEKKVKSNEILITVSPPPEVPPPEVPPPEVPPPEVPPPEEVPPVTIIEKLKKWSPLIAALVIGTAIALVKLRK